MLFLRDCCIFYLFKQAQILVHCVETASNQLLTHPKKERVGGPESPSRTFFFFRISMDCLLNENHAPLQLLCQSIQPSISNSSLHSLSIIRVRSIGASLRHFFTFAVAFRTEENAFPYFLRSKLVFVDTPFNSQIAPVFVESSKHFLRIRGASAKHLTLSPPWIGTQTDNRSNLVRFSFGQYHIWNSPTSRFRESD